MTIHGRSDLHLSRKLWHFLTVISMVLIDHFASRPVSMGLLLFVSVFFISADLIRLNSPRFNKFALRVLGGVLRKNELHHLAGTTYLLLGVVFIYFTFRKPIVELTLILLAVGDPVASICGILFGKVKIIGKKTLEGALGAFFICFFAAFIYYAHEEMMTEHLWVATLATGLVGALCELIPIGAVDDNLSFPILCASALWIIFYLYN